jgi:hypothetical protein
MITAPFFVTQAVQLAAGKLTICYSEKTAEFRGGRCPPVRHWASEVFGELAPGGRRASKRTANVWG